MGTNTVTCSSSESGVQKDVGLTYKLQCPDFNDFCGEFSARCTNDCNAHGLCTGSGVCNCYTGYSGLDCSTQTAVNYALITSGSYYGKLAGLLPLSAFFAALVGLAQL